MEIEAKIKLKSPSRVRSLLRSADAECDGVILEKNWLYDYPDRALAKRDKLLRLRHDHRVLMTYKGPREDSEFKKREEMEIEFPDLPKAQSLLESVGFIKWFYFEKYRESWKLDPCLVLLDELPRLGLYVEIEGPNEEEINKVVKRLKLPRHYITDSYVELLKEDAGKSKSNAVDCVFPPEYQSLLKQDKRSWR